MRLNKHIVGALLLLPVIGYGQEPPPAQPRTVYLSDLAPIGTPINGYGPYEKDRSNGESGGGDGAPLKMGRIPYAKGLGVHAASDLTFALNRQYTTFSAAVGIDDELLTNGCAPDSSGSVVFQVFADGVKLYDSGAVTVLSSALDISVDVTGKNTLRLVVGGAGDDLVCDHADWGEAKLTGAGDIPADSQTFSASSGFSSTQGQHRWSYLDSAGTPLTYRAPGGNPGDAWQGSEPMLIVSRNGGSPGETRDSVRRWTAPRSGTIRLAGSARHEGPTCNGDVLVLIRKGPAPLWQMALSNGDAAGTTFDLTTTVNQNDAIDFVINKGADGNNLCDMTMFDSAIVLTK